MHFLKRIGLFRTQIWRFFDAIFPRKVREIWHPKGLFSTPEPSFRGQSWAQGLWGREYFWFAARGHLFRRSRLPPEVVSARLNFSARGPKKLLLHGKNQVRRALYYWSACQNLGVPYPKWMSCKCAFSINNNNNNVFLFTHSWDKLQRIVIYITGYLRRIISKFI